MLGDVLVGRPPDYNGLLTNLTDIHDGNVWYLDRRFVVSQGYSRLLHSSDLCSCTIPLQARLHCHHGLLHMAHTRGIQAFMLIGKILYRLQWSLWSFSSHWLRRGVL